MTPEPPRDSDRTARGLSGTMRASEMTAETPRPCSTTAPPSATSAPRPRPPSALEPRASSGRPAHPTPFLVNPETGCVPHAVSATDRADPDDTRTPAAPLPVATAFSRPVQPASAVRPAPAPSPAPAADARAVRPEDDVLLDEELRFSEEDLDDSDADRDTPLLFADRDDPSVFADRDDPSVTLDLVPDPDYPDSDLDLDLDRADVDAEPERAPRWDPSGSPTPTPLSRRRSRRDRRVSPDDARSRRYFTSRGLAGVQVRVEVANVEVDERACGDDSDEEAEAVVAAVRRWQDPWQRPLGDTGADIDDADPSASRRRTYSTTEAHPLHPMRGVPAEALGAHLDGPDASLGWMWTMDPLPETPEMAFDPETASRLAAEIADAVLDEEIDAALARAEEALARTEEARARVGEGSRGEVRDSAEDFAASVERTAAASSETAKEKEKEKEKEANGTSASGTPTASTSASGDVPAVLAAAAERSVSSPATNARRFGSFATRSDIDRGELPRIVPPAPPPDLAAAASAPAPDGPESRGPGVVRGVAALARRSKVLGRASSPRLTERDVRDGEAPSPTREWSPLRDFATANHPLGVGYRGFAPGESSAASSAASSSLFGGGDSFSTRADRETRVVSALRGELRSMRDERLELESRCQSLQLRSTVAEWERDQLKVRLEELETAWDQHRRALRREVTTRVKVGLDYAENQREGRTGDREGDDGEGDEGHAADSRDGHAFESRSPALFPQEVLQAVVRGAVDQSVECALGASAAGRSSSGGYDDARDRAPRYVSEGTNAYPGPTGLDGDDGDADPAVSEDAAGVYGMVRDALRVG